MFGKLCSHSIVKPSDKYDSIMCGLNQYLFENESGKRKNIRVVDRFENSNAVTVDAQLRSCFCDEDQINRFFIYK